MGKRTNGDGSFRKRKNGLWEARYYNPVDGKQHSIYGETQREVKDKLKERLFDIEETKDLVNEDMLVSKWFEIWLAFYTSNIKPSTKDVYKCLIRSRIVPEIGDYTIKQLKTDHLQHFYVQMLNDNLSPKTIKNIHGIIHKAMEQAVKLHYVKENVSKACILPKVERRSVHPLDETEVADFIREIRNDKYETIYLVALFTGMRQGEVLGLTWSSIDFEKNIIVLQNQLIRSREGAYYYFGSLKNGKTRTIYMSNYVANLLKECKKLQRQNRQKAGKAWVKKGGLWDDLVFTTETGENLNHHSVYKHFKLIVKRMGIEDVRFHDLRHTYAVISLQNGDDIKTVQEALGHHTSSFTLQVYAHATDRMRQNSAERMDTFIQNMVFQTP